MPSWRSAELVKHKDNYTLKSEYSPITNLFKATFTTEMQTH
jgi:hypothetical protein